jgi:hypothetical protein
MHPPDAAKLRRENGSSAVYRGVGPRLQAMTKTGDGGSAEDGGLPGGQKNKRASRYCDAPLPPLIWLPQHSRRPAVIRPAAMPDVRASGMPSRIARKTGSEARSGGPKADDIDRSVTEPANGRQRPPAWDARCRAPTAPARALAMRYRSPDRSTQCPSRWPDRTNPCTCTRPARSG